LQITEFDILMEFCADSLSRRNTFNDKDFNNFLQIRFKSLFSVKINTKTAKFVTESPELQVSFFVTAERSICREYMHRWFQLNCQAPCKVRVKITTKS